MLLEKPACAAKVSGVVEQQPYELWSQRVQQTKTNGGLCMLVALHTGDERAAAAKSRGACDNRHLAINTVQCDPTFVQFVRRRLREPKREP